jgi:hypothetical protein
MRWVGSVPNVFIEFAGVAVSDYDEVVVVTDAHVPPDLAVGFGG